MDEHQEHQEEPTTEKQKKFGIYFEDDYDYLQHMKAPGTAVLEPVGLGPTENDETATRRQGQVYSNLCDGVVVDLRTLGQSSGGVVWSRSGCWRIR